MKISVFVLLTSVVSMAFSLVIVPATETLACDNEEVYVAFTIIHNWESGFQGQIAITNHTSWKIGDWVLEFDFTHTIGSIWDASILSYTGDHYAVANELNPHIGPGDTVSFGFIASPGGTIEPPFNGQLNDVPCVFNECSPAPPAVEPVAPPSWPARFFAPYVDVTLWPPFDLVQTAQNENAKFFMLGFIVAKAQGDCTPSWGTYYSIDEGFLLSDINAIRDMGGDVMVSFGGAANTELAAACDCVDNLKNAYQSVIDAYNLTHIDFDIEGALVAEPVSIARRSQAIAALQADAANLDRELHVWYTLPVLPTGLTQDGLNVLQSALDYDVEIAGVNIMAMDYGDVPAPDPEGRMGEYAIQAANSLFDQLQNLYTNAGIPKTEDDLWHIVGITPMIGLNDVTTEIFYQEDAREVLNFAQQQDIGMLSFWSANRDKQCPEGEIPWVSPHCSSILQEPFEFSHILLPFTAFGAILYGDTSEDGNITAYDAFLVLQHIVGLIELLPGVQEAADVNTDGVISVLDAALILQYTVGLITSLPVANVPVAPGLNPPDETRLLTKAIEQFEKGSLTREQKHILEQLKQVVTQKLRPTHTTLLQNYPNPCNPDTWLPYHLANDATVTISIYNAKGQLIRTIALGQKAAGLYLSKDKAAYWDGRNNIGEKIASGLYFYSLQAGDFTTTRCMLIIK